jgi:hypothetical protein
VFGAGEGLGRLPIKGMGLGFDEDRIGGRGVSWEKKQAAQTAGCRVDFQVAKTVDNRVIDTTETQHM